MRMINGKQVGGALESELNLEIKKLAKTRAEEIKSTFIEKIFKERKPIRKGIENQLDMEFVDFMYLRLEEVNVKRKYEYSTYSAYKTNIALHMTNYFGSSKRKDLKT